MEDLDDEKELTTAQTLKALAELGLIKPKTEKIVVQIENAFGVKLKELLGVSDKKEGDSK